MYVTLATCWYALNSKFPIDTYLRWMKNMLGGGGGEATNYNLVLFTDEAGEIVLREHFAPYYFQNPRLKMIIKPVDQWFNYQYKSAWQKNHAKNTLLNSISEWKLNMLWAEKIHFVNDARINQYFTSTEFYGWCDIGYFREGAREPSFCNNQKIFALNKNKIYYACIDPPQFHALTEFIAQRNDQGLPMQPIPTNQVSIGGGFFLAHHSKIDGWRTIFDTKLQLYFQHNYLVKDDQMIILDCVVAEPHRFELISEPLVPIINPWFQFRRFLS